MGRSGAASGMGALMGFGPDDEAAAAQGAANEQQTQARSLYTDFMSRAQGNADRLNLLAANPQQLQSLQSSLDQASKSNASDQKLLDAIDPSVMEASKQALNILQGGGPANNSLMQQSNYQRSQLVNSLREQYGPGAETSAIGQNALRQFDLQANAQSQQTLGQLFGMAQGGAAQSAQMQNNMQNRFATSAQGFSQYANQQMNAQQTGFGSLAQGMSSFGQGLMNTAGASFTGLGVKGAGTNAFARSGQSMLSAGFSGKSGGQKPTQPQTTGGSAAEAGSGGGYSGAAMAGGAGDAAGGGSMLGGSDALMLA